MTADADEVIVTAFFSNQVSSVTFSLHLTLPYATFLPVPILYLSLSFLDLFTSPFFFFYL